MLFYLTAAVVLGIDRLTKYLVATWMNPLDSIPVIPGVFHLTYIQNKGAAFGIFQEKTAVFIAITILVIGILVWAQRRYAGINQLLTVSIGLILGGAVGNLWDRIIHGYVVDMFDFRVWPVFNVADSAIVLGVIILGWYILKEPGLLGEEKQSEN